MFFSIPIIIAILLGWTYPYYAYLLSIWVFAPLFLLTFISSLSIDINQLPQILKKKKEISISLVLCFALIPCIQYLLSSLLLNNPNFTYGVLISSLSPVAIVAPVFTQLHKGDVELSLGLFVLSTCLFPLALFLFLLFPTVHHGHLDLIPILKFASLITLLPVAIALVCLYFFKNLISLFKKYIPILSSLLLGIIIFSLFGSISHKTNLSYIPITEIICLTMIMAVPDFGVYILSKKLLSKRFSSSTMKAMAICISLKNLALSGGILLTYAPIASLPAAIGFVIHSIFFGYLFKKRFAS